jgi:cytochrome b
MRNMLRADSRPAGRGWGPAARVETGPAPARVRVWDRVVRLFHWSLVAAIALAAGSGFLGEATSIDIHVWAGTAALALVAARVIWGFLGTRHARFSDFVAGRRAILAHLAGLATGRAERHRGHNPLGGAMILALLAAIVAVTMTGVVVLGGTLKAGPLAFATRFSTGGSARELHESLAVVLLALIGLHVAGAVFESWRTRENLVRAMVDGRKEVRPGDRASRPAAARPALAVAIAASLFAACGALVWVYAARPALGVPVAPLDPAYQAECGACHDAYHPSLLPRASWAALMAGLDDHFGENASLDSQARRHIAAYLAANAAEAYDTQAANRLRRVDAQNPFTITAAPFWRRAHRDVAKAEFASKAVRGRGHCEACHGDAARGRFYPGAIDIPSRSRL